MQRAWCVVASGTARGKAVTGGHSTVANRLPPDSAIAGDPRREPSRRTLLAHRRGARPTGGPMALGLALAVFLGGKARTAAAAGFTPALSVKVRIANETGRVVQIVRPGVRIACKAIAYIGVYLMVTSAGIGYADRNSAQFAPEPSVHVGERAERLAQRAWCVVASGTARGKAVTGGHSTVANRLPPDSAIAGDPRRKPSHRTLLAHRRGVALLHPLSWSPLH